MSLEFTRLQVPGLQVYEASGVLGDTYFLSLGKDTPQAEVANVIVYLEGQVALSRTEGSLSPQHVPDQVRGAGDVSVEKLIALIPAGKLRFEVVTPTFRYYCLTDPQRRPLGAFVHRLAPGDEHAFAIGRRLFVAEGSVVVQGVTYEAPLHVALESAGSTIEAVTAATIVDMELLT
jgi:hypothetical protein